MNSKSMEKSHLFKSMELQRSDMDLSFSVNKKTRRKLWERQRGSFSLACKLMWQPGTVQVRSGGGTVHICWVSCSLFEPFRNGKWEWVQTVGWEDWWVPSKGHTDVIYWKFGEDHHIPWPAKHLSEIWRNCGTFRCLLGQKFSCVSHTFLMDISYGHVFYCFYRILT